MSGEFSTSACAARSSSVVAPRRSPAQDTAQGQQADQPVQTPSGEAAYEMPCNTAALGVYRSTAQARAASVCTPSQASPAGR